MITAEQHFELREAVMEGLDAAHDMDVTFDDYADAIMVKVSTIINSPTFAEALIAAADRRRAAQ